MSLKSQPKGLYVLFFTEAWERFSYYGMRALLVLYLVNQLKMKRADALEIYAIYTGLVYFTPLIGGYLADKYLGARKAILIGGSVMALGHLAMAFEPFLNIALGLLILGNGFFKPNISTIVGGLYEEHDPRRDGGFTIFYMGINLGAFFSPLICGTLGEKIGWHYGFSAASVGMILGLLVFFMGQKIIGPAGFPPAHGGEARTELNRKDYFDVLIYVICSTVAVVGFIEIWKFAGPVWNTYGFMAKGLIVISIIACLEFFRRIMLPDSKEEVEPLTSDEWQRILVICVLAFFVIFFWMGFEQAGGTMTLFADTQTDRHFMGYEIPASYFQSINPLAIMMLAPLFSMFWLWLAESRFAISTPTKMAIGMIMLGLGFIVMYFGQKMAMGNDHYAWVPLIAGGVGSTFNMNVFVFKNGTVGPIWLTLVYVIHTFGELCLSPIGLSMVTKLSPVRMVSLMMGVWLVSSALSNYLAGMLEGLLSAYNMPIYGFLILSSIGSGIVLLMLTPWLKKCMHGRD